MSGGILSCENCIRRAFQALQPAKRPTSNRGFARSHGPPRGAQGFKPTSNRRMQAQGSKEPVTKKPGESLAERAPRERREPSQLWQNKTSTLTREEKAGRAARREAPWLTNEWKLGKEVQQKLAEHNFPEALALVQQTSKENSQVTVSWNHLIGYKMEQGDVRDAIKLFNDMKKRAQKPSVHTYTILFRGFSQNFQKKMAVAEAVKHYNVLVNSDRLEASTIHLNAVLNVCAKAGDLDAMYQVAETANTSVRAPDATTYSIILHGLRSYAKSGIKDMSSTQQKQAIQDVIKQAKSLWSEIQGKWDKGKLMLDESLVGAMGRILLLEPRVVDRQAILDLVEQTMTVPNLAKKEQSRGSAVAKDAKALPGEEKSTSVVKQRAFFVAPGNNTLALVIGMLASTRLTKLGVKYWDIFTQQYGVVPDEKNWTSMFMMLKLAKNSAKAAELISQVPQQVMNERICQEAMEACVRDNINTNTMKHANEVLQYTATKNTPESVPVLQTLRMYLRAALVSHHHLRSQASGGDMTGAKREYGAQIMDALGRLRKPYQQLYEYYFLTLPSKPDVEADMGRIYNTQREIIALARLMFSATNKIVNEDLGSGEAKSTAMKLSKFYNGSIQLFYSRREEIEPKLREYRKLRGLDDELDPKLEDLGEDLLQESQLDEETDAGEEQMTRSLNRSVQAFMKKSSLWGENYRPQGDYIWNTNQTQQEMRQAKAKAMA